MSSRVATEKECRPRSAVHVHCSCRWRRMLMMIIIYIMGPGSGSLDLRAIVAGTIQTHRALVGVQALASSSCASSLLRRSLISPSLLDPAAEQQLASVPGQGARTHVQGRLRGHMASACAWRGAGSPCLVPKYVHVCRLHIGARVKGSL